MHLPTLLAAVHRGDDPVVFEFIDQATPDQLAGDDAVALLAAAAYAGRHEVVDRLVVYGVDVTRPWDGGVDPVVWAAERGRYGVLMALLAGSRDPLAAGSPQRLALRAALDAVDEGLGAGDEPPPAHWAIVTELEAALGLRRSPDQLLVRALVHADPTHDDWFAALLQLGLRADRETFDWARALVEDGRSPARRRFGLDTVNFLGFGLGPEDEDEDELPFARDAADLLRPMLKGEEDPYALGTVIAAFARYCRPEENRAVLVHAGHPDPHVRRRVAGNLGLREAGGVAEDPEVLDTLVGLAADPDPQVRAAVLHTFTWSPVDTPGLRAALAAQLTHPHLEARIAAAAGLALRGDGRGRVVLEEIRADPAHRRTLGPGGLGDLHHVLRSAEAAAGLV